MNIKINLLISKRELFLNTISNSTYYMENAYDMDLKFDNNNMSDNISFSSNRSSIQKFKIVLVGDQNVGKSSIIARYIRNEFDPTKNVPI